MIDAIDKKQMCHSVITGKGNASKEWNYIIAIILTSFNVYFVFDYACFLCICCKTAICFFWDKDRIFLVKTGWQPCFKA